MNDTPRTSPTEPPAHRTGGPLPGTPDLDALLGALDRRLRRGVWMHGLGTVLVASFLWLAFAFLADWALRVPAVVRIFHGVVLLLVAGFFAWHDLLRPLRRIPDRAGLAVLLGRQHPELGELLVSAVQLRAAPSESELSDDLVRGVLAEAEERAPSISPADALDPRGPRRRLLAGFAGTCIAVLLSLAFPLHASIFFRHLLGNARSWPQRTQLVLEIPDLGEGTEVVRSPELVHVRVARGTDVPVIVRAEGVVPDEVLLHFEGGRDIALTATGAGLFRTLLRSQQQDVAFDATGGDDQDGLPRVEIEVLQPPDLGGLAIAVTPPEYTGLAPELVFDRDVEVLEGSHVVVTARPEPSDATGVARLLPEDRTVPLKAMPFPGDAGEGDAPREPVQGLGFDLWADRSLGFRIELVDAKGLSNPDPGLFRVQVVDDRPPEVQVLAPARGEVEVVGGGALPLRARVSDDFGLSGASWIVHSGGDQDGTTTSKGDFALVPIAADASSQTSHAREVALASVRLEVNDLAGAGAQITADQRFELLVLARDNRAPDADEGRSFPVRVRVVTPEELLRRMQDRLGQARLAAVRLSDLQREKRARSEELLTALESSDKAGDARTLSSVIAGQRRVVADARGLAEDLASVAADVLYARIDDKAGALLDAYDQRTAQDARSSFQGKPWRDLAGLLKDGRLGAGGFAGNLVQLVNLALEVSDDGASPALDLLNDGERAVDAKARLDAITQAVERQDATLERIEALVSELAEWDNFQNVLQLTRDILNRQRTLRERTEKFAKEKGR